MQKCHQGMQKWRINFIIDLVLYFVMLAVVGTGLLIKYTLLPGRIAWEVYGCRVELRWLGLDRHQWGTIHLYLGYLLLVLLVLHVFFHWKAVVGGSATFFL